MSRLSRATALASTVALFVVVLASSALAATTTVTDPSGDTPDIRRLTLDNRQWKVVMKQKYEDIALVQVESLYIRWGKATHYRVNIGNYDSDDALERRLWLVTTDGETRKACGDMTFSRAADTDLTTVRVPRACIPRANDSIRAKGIASMGLYDHDATSLTPYAARG
jgi:hypothetical protein